MSEKRFSGVLVPVLTPFKKDLSPDADRFVSLCKWMLNNGATGIAPFGTTSESNSMSVKERMSLLEAAVNGGVNPLTIMPGVGCCSISDNVTLINHAARMGCRAVLMLPPFYYKNVNDDGFFWMVEETINRLSNKAMHIYLYHIPPQTVIGFSLGLVRRLVQAFPENVIGVKDSSGDWSNTQAMIDDVPNFTVFPGSELFLLQGLRAGSAGCITASGNVNPTEIRKVYENWQSPEADKLQERITEVRNVIQRYPMIPALKRIIAHFSGDEAWAQTRPPLNMLSDDEGKALIADLKDIDWELPNAKELGM